MKDLVGLFFLVRKKMNMNDDISIKYHIDKIFLVLIEISLVRRIIDEMRILCFYEIKF